MKKRTIVGIVLGVVAGVVAYYYLVAKKLSEWEKYFSEEDEYDEDFDSYEYEDLDEAYEEKRKQAGCCY